MASIWRSAKRRQRRPERNGRKPFHDSTSDDEPRVGVTPCGSRREQSAQCRQFGDVALDRIVVGSEVLRPQVAVDACGMRQQVGDCDLDLLAGAQSELRHQCRDGLVDAQSALEEQLNQQRRGDDLRNGSRTKPGFRCYRHRRLNSRC
jgi:hypothetical protein